MAPPKRNPDETPHRGVRASGKRATKGLFGGRVIEDFGSIHVFRHEAQGARAMLGKAQPDELRDHTSFGARFGGGTFTLVARSQDNRRIAGRFRVEVPGAPLPIPAVPRRAGDERPFASAGGSLQAIVFPLFREGLGVDAIVERTHVDARMLRALYLEWLTDFGEEPPTTPEEIARRKARAHERRKAAFQAQAELAVDRHAD
jgi:hypothetical protein